MTLAGEKVSAESIVKANETRLATLTSRYNWVLAEPHLDVEIKNGSARRFSKYITMREFKENILSGLSIKDMSKSGISPKVIQFFSNFCQGKIKLTKQEFEECYHSGVSLDEISKKYKVTREDVTSLRQIYGIKRKGAKYLKRKNTEPSLTQVQKEMIYGSLMGDAKRHSSKFNNSVGFGHEPKQQEYVKWKLDMVCNIATPEGIKKYSHYDKRYGKTYDSYRFYTLANSDVEEIVNKFYGENGKRITRDILDNLSELSLAVWYMDDGTTGFSHKTIEKKGWNITPEVRICTDSFSIEECDLIIEWFKERWDIDCHKRENRPNQYRIVLKSTSVSHFFSLITPYIVPSMEYKVSYSAYKQRFITDSAEV